MSLTLSQQRAVHAFDVEIDSMFRDLRKMPPGHSVDVWMAPTRLLYCLGRPGDKHVGRYNNRVPRADFWDDCHALAREQGWDIRPVPRETSRACAFGAQP